MGEAGVAVKIFGKASSLFCIPDKVKMYMHAQFDKNIPCGSRAMSIFIKRL